MKIAAALAVALLMCSGITIATSMSMTITGGNSYAQPAATDVQPLYDYWQPMDTPSDTNAVAPAADQYPVSSQSQINQDSMSLQQGETSDQQISGNWSPSSGVEAASAPVQQPQQQQYPSTMAQPYTTVQPVASSTTSASYQSPSTTGSSSYPQQTEVAATDHGCTEGTRKPVPEQLSSYIICDNGVWIAMTCAPGTVFNALREQCLIGRAAVTIATQSQEQPNQQSSSSSSSSSNNQQQGYGQQSQSQSQPQTNSVQSAPAGNQYPQQVQQVQQQQQQQPQQQLATRPQPKLYGVQSAGTTMQQAYVQPVGNSNNTSAPSYNTQQTQPQQQQQQKSQYQQQTQPQPKPQQQQQQQTQYQQQSQPSQSLQAPAYQQQFQQVTQQPATVVAGGYMATNAQPRQVYQRKRPQQQQAQQMGMLLVKPVKLYMSSQGVQSQTMNANSQYQQMAPATQNQQVQSQQPIYAAKPSSSKPASTTQAPRQPSTYRPSGTGVAQGWQPAPASQMQQMQQSQVMYEASNNQKLNASPSNSYQRPSAAATSYQAPAAAQPSTAASTNQAPAAAQQYSQQSAAGQTETSYDSQPAHQQTMDANNGNLKITFAI